MTTVLRSIFSIFSGKIAGILIGLVFTPLLVRIISQNQYGKYASVLAAFTIVTVIVNGGLFDATRKVVAENTDQPEAAATVISTSLFISIIYAIFATVLVFSSLQFNLVPSTYTSYIWILLCGLLSVNVFTAVRGSFYGLQLESIGELLEVTRKTIYAGFALVFAYIGYDVIGVFAGYSLSYILLSVVGVATLCKYSQYEFPSKKEIFDHGGKIASYGGYQLIGGLSALLLYKTDILLVDFFRGSTSAALYQSAIVPAEMIWFIPSTIQLAFLQHVSKLWSNGNVAEINNNLRTGIKYAMLSLTLFGVGLFALAEPLLTTYFGASYINAADTLRVLILGTFFFGIMRVVVPVLQATGWVRHTEFVTFGALLLNILFNIILIPRYGTIGAGVGTTVSYIFVFIGTMIIWYYSQLNLPPIRWIGKIAMSQSIFAVIFITVVKYSTLPPLSSLLILPPLGLLIFIAVNIIFGHLSVHN